MCKIIKIINCLAVFSRKKVKHRKTSKQNRNRNRNRFESNLIYNKKRKNKILKIK